MLIDILTLFPEMIESGLRYSIPGRAIKKGAVQVRLHNLRTWGIDRHHNVDDKPYGGGAGMVLRVDVADRALETVDPGHRAKRIMLTPDGKLLNQKHTDQLAKLNHLVLLCGRYEGFDARIDNLIDEKLSIGKYVLSGGELAAMVVSDAVIRLLPGVLGNEQSLEHETFEDGLTDFPQYTKPDNYRGWTVPIVLLSGHHEQIAAWRQSLRKPTKGRSSD